MEMLVWGCTRALRERVFITLGEVLVRRSIRGDGRDEGVNRGGVGNVARKRVVVGSWSKPPRRLSRKKQ